MHREAFNVDEQNRIQLRAYRDELEGLTCFRVNSIYCRISSSHFPPLSPPFCYLYFIWPAIFRRNDVQVGPINLDTAYEILKISLASNEFSYIRQNVQKMHFSSLELECATFFIPPDKRAERRSTSRSPDDNVGLHHHGHEDAVNDNLETESFEATQICLPISVFGFDRPVDEAITQHIGVARADDADLTFATPSVGHLSEDAPTQKLGTSTGQAEMSLEASGTFDDLNDDLEVGLREPLSKWNALARLSPTSTSNHGGCSSSSQSPNNPALKDFSAHRNNSTPVPTPSCRLKKARKESENAKEVTPSGAVLSAKPKLKEESQPSKALEPVSNLALVARREESVDMWDQFEEDARVSIQKDEHERTGQRTPLEDRASGTKAGLKDRSSSLRECKKRKRVPGKNESSLQMKAICMQGKKYVDSQRYRLAVLEFTKAWDFYRRQSDADRSSLLEEGALALSSRAQAYNFLAAEVEREKNYALALKDVEAYFSNFPYGAEKKDVFLFSAIAHEELGHLQSACSMFEQCLTILDKCLAGSLTILNLKMLCLSILNKPKPAIFCEMIQHVSKL
jgi:hypothetical protein